MSSWPTLNDLIGGGSPLGGSEVGGDFRLPEGNRPLDARDPDAPLASPSSARSGSTLDVLVPVQNPAIADTAEPDAPAGSDADVPPGFDEPLPPSLVTALALESGAVEYEEPDYEAPVALGNPDFEQDGVLSLAGGPSPDDVEDNQYEPDLPELVLA
ncbi:MAG: hypothetical protein LPL29_12100 [Alphaproteobacteria bacterium]|nr:hypothetical protein [Alphaproteobacteria bacterium]MDX5370105.1 hypothetical protein [Alphaproteobacteria bacterium]